MVIPAHIRSVISALVVLGPPGIAAGGEAVFDEGRALVEMYCADCHATGATGDSPLPIAPRFRELYLSYDVSLLGGALVEGLVTGHDVMPEFEFDPWQADAIIDYLKSLEPNAD